MAMMIKVSKNVSKVKAKTRGIHAPMPKPREKDCSEQDFQNATDVAIVVTEYQHGYQNVDRIHRVKFWSSRPLSGQEVCSWRVETVIS